MTNPYSLKEELKKRILVLDGAMGTMLQKQNLSESDFRKGEFLDWEIDLKGNNEVLSITKPEAIEKVHRAYLEAGADIIETNTFSANFVSQRDYGLERFVEEMNTESVKIAKKLAKEYSTNDKPRFVAGSIGPTNKSLSISPDVMNPDYREISFDDLVYAYKQQVRILAKEGVDVFLIETIFDTLNAKAAIYAIKEVLEETGRDIPTILSVTLTDKSGRTLSGQTLKAFYYSIEHTNPIAVGLNCSMGIANMIPHIEELSKYVSSGISVYANAGLPDEFGNYVQTPEDMAEGYKYLAKNGLLNIAGGCCGTTPEHIKAIYNIVKNYIPKKIERIDNASHFCGLESFDYDGHQNFIMVGERANVTGSKRFASLIKDGKFNEAVDIAKKQVEDGANILDVSMDMDLTDVKGNLCKFLNLISAEPEISKVPIMIDSSDFSVIEAGMKCIQSKPIINSISLKSGEDVFVSQANKIRELGGMVVVMAFDENGQAIGVRDRIDVVSRSYNILTEKCGISPTDIIFDLNVFPLATGMKEHNKNATSFIGALKVLKQKFPKSLFSGGISNISFSFRGMNKIREAIHSVFLYHAIQAGLDLGIVNAKMLIPYDEIEEPLKTLVEDVVLDKDDLAVERLLKYAQSVDLDHNSNQTDSARSKSRDLNVEGRIQNSLLTGDTTYLKEDLKEALETYSPIEIIEKILLEGMNIIGEKFGQGKMFLPQVVKSSRIMKDAVDYLKSDIEKSSSKSNLGTIVLATVKGDVHDIGKNILSLMLTCNGFKVVDLGVMVNEADILLSAKENNADIIALSGLITPSLDEMCSVASRMEAEGFKLPAIMVGGATTSKRHTAIKIAPKYNGLVVQTGNASEAVFTAQKIVSKDNEFIKKIKEEQKKILDEYNEKYN